MPTLTDRRQISLCVVGMALGVAVLAVPGGDEGRVLVPISDGHGRGQLGRGRKP